MADKVDNRAFAEMEYATADKTAVDLLGDKPRVTKENVHDMLMAAGFTPGLGNIADAADALLYAVEGEFGSAALSAAAMIPFIGQAVSAKKALKVAKASGEEMVTLYRGVGRWYPGKMVKKGNFVGGDKNFPMNIWATRTKKAAHEYGGYVGDGKRIFPEGRTLEFEVPRSFFKKHAKVYIKDLTDTPHEAIKFDKGIPKAFLKKVHR